MGTPVPSCAPGVRFWLAAASPAIASVVLLVMPAYNMFFAGRVDNATGRRSPHWGKYRTGVLVVAYLLFPTVSREVVRVLDCSEDLGGHSYLKVCRKSIAQYRCTRAVAFACAWCLRGTRSLCVRGGA